ncbi:hypothetical protein H6P81_013320 [Aristolochia fimbriata]|uniref:Uncharacterized protein n=1 Tax=Aristolochia fimbriata TaxID=158543 RepID=A0AAV7EI07_ARIFI|nr:hypothetical protein H6P81_013320 [Aristolochia fimbriata]
MRRFSIHANQVRFDCECEISECSSGNRLFTRTSSRSPLASANKGPNYCSTDRSYHDDNSDQRVLVVMILHATVLLASSSKFGSVRKLTEGSSKKNRRSKARMEDTIRCF